MVRARPRHLAERMSLDSTDAYRRYVATDQDRIRARCSPLAPSVRWLESPSRVLDERGADLDTRGAGRSRGSAPSAACCAVLSLVDAPVRASPSMVTPADQSRSL